MGLFSSIKKAASSAVKKVTTKVNNVKSTVSHAASSVKSAVSNAMPSAGAAVSTLKGAVSGAATGFAAGGIVGAVGGAVIGGGLGHHAYYENGGADTVEEVTNEVAQLSQVPQAYQQVAAGAATDSTYNFETGEYSVSIGKNGAPTTKAGIDEETKKKLLMLGAGIIAFKALAK